MKLNELALWLVVLICAVQVWHLLLSLRQRHGMWLALAVQLLLELAALAIGWWFWPAYSGLVPLGMFALLVMIPNAGFWLEERLAARQQFRLARYVALVLRWLHPFDGRWQEPEIYRAFELLHQGHLDQADTLFQSLATRHQKLGWFATIYRLRVADRWEELRTWVESAPPDEHRLEVFSVAYAYLRTLGELNLQPELLRKHAAIAPKFAHDAQAQHSLRLLVLAFCGLPNQVQELFDGPLRNFEPFVKQFWLATAQQAAGNSAANTAWQDLVDQHDPFIRAGVARRQRSPLQPFDIASLAHEEKELLARVITPPLAEQPHYSLASPPPGVPVATYSLIAALVVMFLLTEYRLTLHDVWSGHWLQFWTLTGGGSLSLQRLTEMGALSLPWPKWPTASQPWPWWQLFTAGLLHHGWLHLLINLGALAVFGRFIEQTLGMVQFLRIYILTGVGAMAVLVIAASVQGLHAKTVGASGSVMGLVGFALILTLRQWWQRRSTLLWHSLSWLVLAIAIETVFDLMNPHVSFTAHLSGMILGMLLAAITRTEPPHPENAEPART